MRLAGATRLLHDAWRAAAGVRIDLPSDMVTCFPELAEVRWRHGGIPLLIGGWFLGQRAVAGFTLGRTVFLADGAAASARLVLHELAHVRQYRRDRAFVLRYLWESVRRGYAGNRYEAAADQFAEEALWSATQRRPS